MSFSFQSVDQRKLAYTPGKIVCVGRNYLEHIQELENEIPDEAVFFIKPGTALSHLCQTCEIPTYRGEIHYECELALLITQKLTRASAEHSLDAVGGYGLALDLTLRQLQSELKEKGLPWEKAKAFDGSCPLSPLKMVDGNFSSRHRFNFSINGKLRQTGDSRLMIRDSAHLLAEISQWFTLMPGDVVLTGTPAGVGILSEGDELELVLDGTVVCRSTVVKGR